MAGIDYTDAATGLRVTDEPRATGARARAIYRGAERIYHCEPVGAGYFLKGYAAAKTEPIEDLLCDPRINDVHVLEAARTLLEERGQDTEDLEVAIEAIRHPKRCTLCACHATGERFGFRVCDYHEDHTEDDPPCPKCAAYAERDKR